VRAVWAVAVLVVTLSLSLSLSLALAPVARSAPITFDLTGVVGSWSRTTDMNASNPATNGGPCAAGMQSAPAPSGAGNDCFRHPFAPGSSISIDITGDRVELLGGTLIVDSVIPLVFNTIVLTQHREWTIEPGLIGTINAYDYISWISPENGWMNWASYSDTGTISCDGPNCALISMAEGQVYPIHPLFEHLSNTSQAPGLVLGDWLLNAARDTILGSSTTVHTWSNVVELDNRRSGAFTFGPTQFGVYYCPEPTLSALLLAGAALLVSARRRRMR